MLRSERFPPRSTTSLLHVSPTVHFSSQSQLLCLGHCAQGVLPLDLGESAQKEGASGPSKADPKSSAADTAAVRNRFAAGFVQGYTAGYSTGGGKNSNGGADASGGMSGTSPDGARAGRSSSLQEVGGAGAAAGGGTAAGVHTVAAASPVQQDHARGVPGTAGQSSTSAGLQAGNTAHQMQHGSSMRAGHGSAPDEAPGKPFIALRDRAAPWSKNSLQEGGAGTAGSNEVLEDSSSHPVTVHLGALGAGDLIMGAGGTAVQGTAAEILAVMGAGGQLSAEGISVVAVHDSGSYEVHGERVITKALTAAVRRQRRPLKKGGRGKAGSSKHGAATGSHPASMHSADGADLQGGAVARPGMPDAASRTFAEGCADGYAQGYTVTVEQGAECPDVGADRHFAEGYAQGFARGYRAAAGHGSGVSNAASVVPLHASVGRAHSLGGSGSAVHGSGLEGALGPGSHPAELHARATQDSVARSNHGAAGSADSAAHGAAVSWPHASVSAGAAAAALQVQGTGGDGLGAGSSGAAGLGVVGAAGAHFAAGFTDGFAESYAAAAGQASAAGRLAAGQYAWAYAHGYARGCSVAAGRGSSPQLYDASGTLLSASAAGALAAEGGSLDMGGRGNATSSKRSAASGSRHARMRVRRPGRAAKSRAPCGLGTAGRGTRSASHGIVGSTGRPFVQGYADGYAEGFRVTAGDGSEAGTLAGQRYAQGYEQGYAKGHSMAAAHSGHGGRTAAGKGAAAGQARSIGDAGNSTHGAAPDGELPSMLAGDGAASMTSNASGLHGMRGTPAGMVMVGGAAAYDIAGGSAGMMAGPGSGPAVQGAAGRLASASMEESASGMQAGASQGSHASNGTGTTGQDSRAGNSGRAGSAGQPFAVGYADGSAQGRRLAAGLGSGAGGAAGQHYAQGCAEGYARGRSVALAQGTTAGLDASGVPLSAGLGGNAAAGHSSLWTGSPGSAEGAGQDPGSRRQTASRHAGAAAAYPQGHGAGEPGMGMQRSGVGADMDTTAGRHPAEGYGTTSGGGSGPARYAAGKLMHAGMGGDSSPTLGSPGTAAGSSSAAGEWHAAAPAIDLASAEFSKAVHGSGAGSLHVTGSDGEQYAQGYAQGFPDGYHELPGQIGAGVDAGSVSLNASRKRAAAKKTGKAKLGGGVFDRLTKQNDAGVLARLTKPAAAAASTQAGAAGKGSAKAEAAAGGGSAEALHGAAAQDPAEGLSAGQGKDGAAGTLLGDGANASVAGAVNGPIGLGTSMQHGTGVHACLCVKPLPCRDEPSGSILPGSDSLKHACFPCAQARVAQQRELRRSRL